MLSTLLIAAACTLGPAASGASAQEEPAPAKAEPTAPAASEGDDPKPEAVPVERMKSKLDGYELDQDILQRIDKGLVWLASRQRADGAWGGNPASAGKPTAHELACTSLSGLAFLAGGHTPGRGPYGKHLARAVQYVVTQAKEVRSGYLGDNNGRMYSHGFAALFLAEVVGVADDPDLRAEVRTALNKAIRLIVDTQDRNGGWWYYPNRDSGSNGADISVTICEVMALRAAMGSGLHIPVSTVNRAVDLVRGAAQPSGHFAYRVVGGRASESRHIAYPRSAAGVCMLYLLGQYSAPELKRGLKYIDRQLSGGALVQPRIPAHFYYYAVYYSVIALYQWGGEPWSRHFPKIRDDLRRRQNEDGSWPPAYGGNRDTTSTAMALIALQVPKRYLPILKR
ncbi:MAG: prenyltransferase/squalene oxidase repeat-containing protein [Planctomycetota bacterium]|jgi:hypothetical protein